MVFERFRRLGRKKTSSLTSEIQKSEERKAKVREAFDKPKKSVRAKVRSVAFSPAVRQSFINVADRFDASDAPRRPVTKRVVRRRVRRRRPLTRPVVRRRVVRRRRPVTRRVIRRKARPSPTKVVSPQQGPDPFITSSEGNDPFPFGQ